jgi:two-component system, NarL family, sensor histidine kinase UhpB
MSALAHDQCVSQAKSEIEQMPPTQIVLTTPRVVRDNSDRDLHRQLEIDGEKSNDQLVAQILNTIEQERRKLSHDLHDILNADLVATSLLMARLRALLRENMDVLGNNALRLELINSSESIASLINRMYSSSRSIVRSLHPETLDTLGLHQAIEELVASFRFRFDRCGFSLDLESDVLLIAGDSAISAYRIVQEAMTNAAKHSQASEIAVRCFKRADAERITIVVSDNGTGFDVLRKEAGLGLISMEKRAQSIGAQLRVDSRQNGTRVSLDLGFSSLTTRS